jgi:hypothetical protein
MTPCVCQIATRSSLAPEGAASPRQAAAAAPAPAAAASAAVSAAAASSESGKLYAWPGVSGVFIVEEIERRQADVGDFLLIESGDLKRRRILPEYIGYRSGSRRRKDADGISAGDPPVDAAKDTPAIPSTDTALLVLGRCPFEARFACGIAEFLLSLSFPYPSTKCATNLLHS